MQCMSIVILNQWYHHFFLVKLDFSAKEMTCSIFLQSLFCFWASWNNRLLVKAHNISQDNAKNLAECVLRLVITFVLLMYSFNHIQTFLVFHAYFFLVYLIGFWKYLSICNVCNFSIIPNFSVERWLKDYICMLDEIALWLSLETKTPDLKCNKKICTLQTSISSQFKIFREWLE